MKKTIMAVLLFTTFLFAQVSSAELSPSIGFVVTNPDGTIAFLEECGDEYRLELNEIEGSDFLVDFVSATSSDTEINELGLYLIAIEGVTEAELSTYYEGIPEFSEYLQGAASGWLVPYAYVQTGQWDAALGGFRVHLIDAAKKHILDINEPITFPGDFQCGKYTFGDILEGTGIGFTLVIENPSCEEDGDDDGISDACDSCPDTEQYSNVDEYGCSQNRSIAELVEESCLASSETDETAWKNHGEYVRCVAHAARALFDEGAISREEKGAIISEAARSDIGKRVKEHLKAKKNKKK